jgi:hypothetical protein
MRNRCDRIRLVRMRGLGDLATKQVGYIPLPPATMGESSVIEPAWSEVRNAADAAISLGWPGLPSGVGALGRETPGDTRTDAFRCPSHHRDLA